MKLDRAKECAISHGGTLLSTKIVSDDENLVWQCSEGHRWSATFHGVVYKHHWCPECYRRRTISSSRMDAFHEWCLKRGYLLRSEYISAAKPVSVECNKGHVWSVRPMNIIETTSCPYCSGKRMCFDMLDDMMMRKKWVLLSKFVDDREAIMNIRCASGHEFSASYNDLHYRKKECPACKKLNRKELNI